MNHWNAPRHFMPGMISLLFMIQTVVTADPYSVNGDNVTAQAVRFQVCSPGLIRMEYSPSSNFVDLPTVVVENRDWPDCPFDVSEKDGMLILDTGRMTIAYKLNSGKFSGDNLSISSRPDRLAS
jgi:hypothetical protein